MKQPLSIPQAKMSEDIFLTEAWQQHIDVISHLSQFSQDILLVISPQGAGKTTFARHFLDCPTPDVQKIFITAKKDKEGTKLLTEISQALKLVVQAPYDLTVLRREIQIACDSKPFSTLLMIDDAHLLEDETLQNILSLISFDKQRDPKLYPGEMGEDNNSKSSLAKGIHLILFSEPSLELRLFSPKFTSIIQGNFYTIELEAWTLSELTAYFEQSSFSMLNSDKIARIFQESQGLPGPAIQEAQKLLSPKRGKKMQKFDFKRWCSRPILIGAIMGVTIGTAYLLVNNIEEEGSTSIPINMAQIAESEWENQDDAPRKPIAFEFDKSDEVQDHTLETQKESLSAQDIPPMEQSEALQDPEMMEDVPDSVALGDETDTDTLPNQLSEKQVESRPPVEQKEIATISPTSSQLSLNTKEQHLMKTSAHHYTIQLLGTRSEESIKQFIQQHAIANSAHYYRTQLDGKDWYVMVYGEYPSREDAKVAMQKLPLSLQQAKLQPWIREVSSIQQDIRERHA